MANFEKGIGLNANQLHKDIREFKRAMTDVKGKIVDAGFVLFDGLREKWASPDAVAKSRDWSRMLSAIWDNLIGDRTVTIDKVEDAAELIAKSLGTSYERVENDIGMNYAHGKGDDMSDYLGWGGLFRSISRWNCCYGC